MVQFFDIRLSGLRKKGNKFVKKVFFALIGLIASCLIVLPAAETVGVEQGTRKWMFETGGSVISSPAIGSDGTLYMGSNDGNLYAVNPGGRLKWKFQTEGAVHSRPAIASDGTIYIGSFDHYVYAVNPNGSLKWRFPTGAEVNASPVLDHDGTIYIGSFDHHVYAINPNGSLKWKFQTEGELFSAPTIGADGTIYVTSWDHNLYALIGNPPVETVADKTALVATQGEAGAGATSKATEGGAGAGAALETTEGEADAGAALEEAVEVASEDNKKGVPSTIEKENRSIRKIRFENTTDGEEKVIILITQFQPPKKFRLDDGRPRLVYDFPNTRLALGVGHGIKANGKLIRQVRIAFHKKPRLKVRVVMDLVSHRGIEIEQKFLKDEDLFIITLKRAKGSMEKQ